MANFLRIIQKLIGRVLWGMRDKISHHYFEIDTDVVFRTIDEDIPQMTVVIDMILADLENM